MKEHQFIKRTLENGEWVATGILLPAGNPVAFVDVLRYFTGRKCPKTIKVLHIRGNIVIPVQKDKTETVWEAIEAYPTVEGSYPRPLVKFINELGGHVQLVRGE